MLKFGKKKKHIIPYKWYNNYNWYIFGSYVVWSIEWLVLLGIAYNHQLNYPSWKGINYLWNQLSVNRDTGLSSNISYSLNIQTYATFQKLNMRLTLYLTADMRFDARPGKFSKSIFIFQYLIELNWKYM